jgi:hypothetical protein
MNFIASHACKPQVIEGIKKKGLDLTRLPDTPE